MMINPASKDATVFATTEVGRRELIDAFTFHRRSYGTIFGRLAAVGF